LLSPTTSLTSLVKAHTTPTSSTQASNIKVTNVVPKLVGALLIKLGETGAGPELFPVGIETVFTREERNSFREQRKIEELEGVADPGFGVAVFAAVSVAVSVAALAGKEGCRVGEAHEEHEGEDGPDNFGEHSAGWVDFVCLFVWYRRGVRGGVV